LQQPSLGMALHAVMPTTQLLESKPMQLDDLDAEP